MKNYGADGVLFKVERYQNGVLHGKTEILDENRSIYYKNGSEISKEEEEEVRSIEKAQGKNEKKRKKERKKKNKEKIE